MFRQPVGLPSLKPGFVRDKPGLRDMITRFRQFLLREAIWSESDEANAT
jgi:hypothetical protein